MDAIKLNSQCKMCNLLLRYPAIWERAHRMVIAENITQVKVTDYLNGEVAKLNAALPDTKTLKVFSTLNLSTHFRNHVPDMSALEDVLAGNYAFNKKEVPRGRSVDTSMLTAVPVSSTVDDFARIHQLVEASFNRLMEFDRKMAELDDEGKPKEFDLSDIQLFQKLIKEAMSMKKDLSSMQKSADIAGEALHECVRTLVQVAMDDLKKVLGEAKANLARELPGSGLPSETVSLVLNAMGKTFSSSVPELLESIEKRYKIK